MDDTGSDSGFLDKGSVRLFLSEFRHNVKSTLGEHKADLNNIFEKLNEANKRIFTIEGEVRVLRSEIAPRIDNNVKTLDNHIADDDDSFEEIQKQINELKDIIKDMKNTVDEVKDNQKESKFKISGATTVFAIAGSILALVFAAEQSGLFSLIAKLIRGAP